jgi:hypothetical protein
MPPGLAPCEHSPCNRWKFGAVTVRGSEGPSEKWGVREGPSSVPLGDQDRQAAGRRLLEPKAVESLHRREV